MSNLYDFLKKSTSFKKIEIDELLFVEYTCDPGGPRAEIWSHTNYFTYVVFGKMTLKHPLKNTKSKQENHTLSGKVHLLFHNFLTRHFVT
jgi:hypothetical protein